MRADIYDFYSLGLGDPYPVSSVHGIGTGDVLDAIVENLPTEVEEENPDIIRFSLIGRPNVGKSSLGVLSLHKCRREPRSDSASGKIV